MFHQSEFTSRERAEVRTRDCWHHHLLGMEICARTLPILVFMVILLLILMPEFPFFISWLLSGASVHIILAEDAFLKMFFQGPGKEIFRIFLPCGVTHSVGSVSAAVWLLMWQIHVFLNGFSASQAVCTSPQKCDMQREKQQHITIPLHWKSGWKCIKNSPWWQKHSVSFCLSSLYRKQGSTPWAQRKCHFPKIFTFCKRLFEEECVRKWQSQTGNY